MRSRLRSFACCAPVIVGCFAMVAPAEDWVRFRGPNGAGVADAKGLPASWSDSENLLWKIKLPGPGSSSPIVRGNRIYVTSYSGYGVDRENPGDVANLQRHLGCYELSTGKSVWDTTIKSLQDEEPYSGFLTDHGYASSTPTIDDERVYAFFGRSGVFAFDHEGKQVWHAPLGKQNSFNSWGSATSLILVDDVLVVNADAEDECLLGLDRRTGKEIWRAEAKGYKGSWGTPVVAETPDGMKELVLCMPGEVWGMDPKNGSLNWFCETRMSPPANTSVVTEKGIVYVVMGSPGMNATMAIRTGGQDDVTGTHVLWRKDVGSYVPSPVLVDGHLYWVNNQGLAICLEAATGNEVYRERLPNAGMVYASLLAADGKLFAVTRRNGTFVLKAEPKFQRLALNKLQDSTDFNASPSVHSGRLLLRSNTGLYCIGAN